MYQIVLPIGSKMACLSAVGALSWTSKEENPGQGKAEMVSNFRSQFLTVITQAAYLLSSFSSLPHSVFVIILCKHGLLFKICKLLLFSLSSHLSGREWYDIWVVYSENIPLWLIQKSLLKDVISG